MRAHEISRNSSREMGPISNMCETCTASLLLQSSKKPRADTYLMAHVQEYEILQNFIVVMSAFYMGSVQSGADVRHFCLWQGYEIPRDFIVEMDPFSKGNHLLTDSGKPARGKLKAK